MGLCLVAQCYRDARHRYACENCAERMRRQLRETESYMIIIRATKDPGRPAFGGRRAPGIALSAPGALSKLVVDDDRSRSTGDGVDDTDDVPSIIGSLHGIARWLREELDVSEPRGPVDLGREVGWLLTMIDWCTTQQWVNELADDISRVHRVARHNAGDSPPGPVGRCRVPDCEGLVFPALVVDVTSPLGPRVEGGRCAACDMAYDWLELARVERLTECPQQTLVTLDTLAWLTQRSPHTIRARCTPADRRNGRPLYDLNEAEKVLSGIPTRGQRVIPLTN